MHEYGPSQSTEQGALVAAPDVYDPNTAEGHLPSWIPPSNEDVPLVDRVSTTSADEAPQWPEGYTTPIDYPAPAGVGRHRRPQAVTLPNLMDGMDHGAFVAPVAPVESEAEAYHSFDQVPRTEQRPMSVEELAQMRGLGDFGAGTITRNALIKQTRRINSARRRGIHLS